MKNSKLTFLLAAMVLLCSLSCNAEKRISRILEKHPEVVASYNDTTLVEVQVLDSMTVTIGDTNYMWYYVKDTIYEVITSKTVLDPSKVSTRQEKKLQAKEDRVKIRQEAKTDRTETRQENKTGSNWAFYWTFAALLVAVAYILWKRRTAKP